MSEFSFFDLTTQGEGGYEMYRVPGMTVLENGEILLSYEAREKDSSRRSLLLRRSADGGKTFAPPCVIKRAEPGIMLHNPLFLAGKRGEVFFFWNEDYRRLYLQKSTDSGHSWGAVAELTGVVEGWRPVWPLTLFAIAPGHGICMKNGTLVLPLWLSRGENAHAPACFATLYSRDSGINWQRSNLVCSNQNVTDPTEGAVAERSDGTLLATIRHSAQATRRRAFVRGTECRWGEATLEHTLPDPICAGSLLTLPDQTLLFSNCAFGDECCLALRRTGSTLHWSKDARQRLTIRISKDDGKSWSCGLELAFEGGYSDLGCSPDGNWIYCFFERNWIDGDCVLNQHLSFARMTRELLS